MNNSNEPIEISANLYAQFLLIRTWKLLGKFEEALEALLEFKKNVLTNPQSDLIAYKLLEVSYHKLMENSHSEIPYSSILKDIESAILTKFKDKTIILQSCKGDLEVTKWPSDPIELAGKVSWTIPIKSEKMNWVGRFFSEEKARSLDFIDF